MLFDGTGRPPRPGDLLIRGERIAEVGSVPPPSESIVFDCTGLSVAPGFIDVHSHSDLQVLENRPEKVLQGVTTEVVGNCGFSPYPAPADRTPLWEFANGIFCGGEDWGWSTARDYVAEAGARAQYANVYSLVGHGSLRIAVAGTRLGPLPEHDMDKMQGLLAEALEEGSCGLSTGLMYSPGASAPFEELERLCRVVARHGKIYATHMRNYSEGLEDAVEEQLNLARRTNCRLQISHFQAVGPANWTRQARALEAIENAWADGIDVAFDCYPYTHGSTVMTQLLPQWALEGGIAGLMARLTHRAERARIAAQTQAALAQGWDGIFIAGLSCGDDSTLVGKCIEEIGRLREREPVEAALDLLVEYRGGVNILERNQSEENLQQALTHPLSLVISDGFYVRGRPHPRLHGTFPYLLGEISRQRRWLSVEESIQKITGAPAARFGIADRGRLLPGYFADVSVFDARTVGSPATYQVPERPPVGIRWVFRNGQLVVGAQPDGAGETSNHVDERSTC
jgi:dihydroorotase/N-acyl-D-amino-acid deacylase